MTEKYYYFGRLNIIGYRDTKEQFLEKVFSSQYYDNDENYKWGFLNVTKFHYEGRTIFFGNLVKYSPKDHENIFSEDEHRIIDIALVNRVVAESNFILDNKTGILAYNDIHGKLRYLQFIKYFCRLIDRSLVDELVNSEIDFLNDESTFFDQIDSFEKVEVVKIDLHPSNPNNREIWKDTDERLQYLNAEKYSQRFYSRKGLNIKEDIKMVGNITMALDAYGSASVEGYVKGKKTMITTGDKPMKQKGETEGDKVVIVKSIWNKFKELFERMSK